MFDFTDDEFRILIEWLRLDSCQYAALNGIHMNPLLNRLIVHMEKMRQVEKPEDEEDR